MWGEESGGCGECERRRCQLHGRRKREHPTIEHGCAVVEAATVAAYIPHTYLCTYNFVIYIHAFLRVKLQAQTCSNLYVLMHLHPSAALSFFLPSSLPSLPDGLC